MTELPDEAIEAFFLGDSHDAWEQDEALVSLADEVLGGATGPPPIPSPALRAFLGEPDTVAAGPAPSARGTNVVPLFRRLRLTVGIAAAAGVAAAALAVAGTTGVLPEPVMQAVSWVVEAVTPFEVREPARTVTGGDDGPGRGPTSTVPGGPFGTGAGSGPAGPGGAPGQPGATTPGAGPGAPGRPGSTRPVTPPASIPAGVPRPVEPPGAGDQGGQRPPAPFVPVVPQPGGISPFAGDGGGTPSTTSVDSARHAPAGATVPSTVTGRTNRR